VQMSLLVLFDGCGVISAQDDPEILRQ